MFDVNDDMDELFRRAAENYPLKTDSADWEKVTKDITASEPANKNKHWLGDRRSLLLLSLLLPGAIICNRYSHVASTGNSKAQASSKAQAVTVHTKTDIAQTTTQTGRNFSHARDEDISSKNSIDALKNSGKTSSIYINYNKQNNRTALVAKAKPDRYFGSSPDVAINQPEEIAAVPNSTSSHAIAAGKDSNQARVEPNKVLKEAKQESTEALANNAPSKKEEKASKKQLHLYAGLVGNVDLSTVKFQALRSPGTGLGFLIGLQITKHLSIESGIYTQKKFYYTDAKFYKPQAPYTAPTFKLLNVDGNCSMYELPVNLKFDFKTTAKSKWYLIAGMSSYFMKKENYTYTSEMWGRVSQKDVSYDSESSSVLSIINIGAGYQRKLGKSGTLRIEPYIKLPLKGFGWGRLPIMSSGLNVGYTRRLF